MIQQKWNQQIKGGCYFFLPRANETELKIQHTTCKEGLGDQTPFSPEERTPRGETGGSKCSPQPFEEQLQRQCSLSLTDVAWVDRHKLGRLKEDIRRSFFITNSEVLGELMQWGDLRLSLSQTQITCPAIHSAVWKGDKAIGPLEVLPTSHYTTTFLSS